MDNILKQSVLLTFLIVCLQNFEVQSLRPSFSQYAGQFSEYKPEDSAQRKFQSFKRHRPIQPYETCDIFPVICYVLKNIVGPHYRARKKYVVGYQEINKFISSPCAAPPLDYEFYTCNPREKQRPAFVSCGIVHCKEANTISGCCTMILDGLYWKVCGEDKIITSYSKPTPFPDDLPKCSLPMKCTLEEDVIKKDGQCCDDEASPYPRSCCVEKGRGGKKKRDSDGGEPQGPDVYCYPHPVRVPEYVQCRTVDCRRGKTCFIPGTENQCCEHENQEEKLTCCLRDTSGGFIPPKLEMKYNVTLPFGHGQFECYDPSERSPDYIQCPNFQCGIKFESYFYGTNVTCCTFEALGISWICCRDKGCTRSYEEVSFPRCSNIICEVKKSLLKKWSGTGNRCCEDDNTQSPMTCCLEKHSNGEDFVHCIPRESRPPTPLKCIDSDLSQVRLCLNKIFHVAFCCEHDFPEGKMICCNKKMTGEVQQQN